MKIIILFSIVALAIAAPALEKPLATGNVITLIRFTQTFNPDGSYRFSFETADGYSREETGSIVNLGMENAYVAAVGFYKYKNSDGEVVEVHYTADDKGFLPRGTNIPEITVVPALPEVPLTSALPEVPIVTALPEVPVTPALPELPVVVAATEVSVVTTLPEVPVTPALPEVSVVPALPEVTMAPAQ